VFGAFFRGLTRLRRLFGFYPVKRACGEKPFLKLIVSGKPGCSNYLGFFIDSLDYHLRAFLERCYYNRVANKPFCRSYTHCLLLINNSISKKKRQLLLLEFFGHTVRGGEALDLLELFVKVRNIGKTACLGDIAYFVFSRAEHVFGVRYTGMN